MVQRDILFERRHSLTVTYTNERSSIWLQRLESCDDVLLIGQEDMANVVYVPSGERWTNLLSPQERSATPLIHSTTFAVPHLPDKWQVKIQFLADGTWLVSNRFYDTVAYNHDKDVYLWQWQESHRLRIDSDIGETLWGDALLMPVGATQATVYRALAGLRHLDPSTRTDPLDQSLWRQR